VTKSGSPPYARASKPRDAKETAFRLLSRRSHSRQELSRKLGQRGFDGAAIGEAIALCDSLGYLDDAALARRWRIRMQENGYGARRIRMTLAQKGFTPEQIDGAFSGYDAGSGEAALAERILARKIGPGGPLQGDRKAREKWYRFLCSRGFSGSDALTAVNRLLPLDRWGPGPSD
jgi:regulatory protein